MNGSKIDFRMEVAASLAPVLVANKSTSGFVANLKALSERGSRSSNLSFSSDLESNWRLKLTIYKECHRGDLEVSRHQSQTLQYPKSQRGSKKS